MTTGFSLCVTCEHFRGDQTCAAFPDGVPEAILFEGGDHSQPWPGDNGIRYSPQPGVDGEAMIDAARFFNEGGQ